MNLNYGLTVNVLLYGNDMIIVGNTCVQKHVMLSLYALYLRTGGLQSAHVDVHQTRYLSGSNATH